MNRRHDRRIYRAPRRRQQLPAVLHQLELRSQNRLRGDRAETDHDPRPDCLELRLEPRPARFDLRHAWFLVDAPLAARLPFEVLDRVGEVDVAPQDAGILERLVEHRTGWSHEWDTLAVFLVARLLPNEHDARLTRAGAKHHLGRGLVEVPTATFL